MCIEADDGRLARPSAFALACPCDVSPHSPPDAKPGWWRWLALLTLALASACSAGATVSVQASRDGDAIVVQATANLRADAHLAWEVVTAYDHYADFVPGLQSSRVIMRSGNSAVVEQRGRVGFFLFHFPLEVRLVVTETPFARVKSYAVSGNFKQMTGTYELNLDGPILHLTYSGRIVPAFQLPPVIGPAAVRHAAEEQFTALVNEIRRREGLTR